MDYSHNFIRFGKGSLGGKARGLAFANSIIINNSFKKKYNKIKIRLPKTLVIGTSEFDDFMDKNKLWDFALSSSNNSLIEKKFLNASLSKTLIKFSPLSNFKQLLMKIAVLFFLNTV